jgi:hypothetical protein
VDGGVATWNRVCNWSGGLIERDIVHTKTPDEIFYISDAPLVRLGGKEGFEHPLATMYLLDMAQFFQRGDASPHDWYFSGAVVNFLDADWPCAACIDQAFVVLYGDDLSLVIKNGPILL